MANSSSAQGVSGDPTTPESRDPPASETPNSAAPASAASTSREAAVRDANQASPPESIGLAGDTDSDTDDSHTSESPREAHPAGATANGAPVVEWPTEESRKIIALRLVSAPAARFPGRAVRQALAAEGFVLGKFDIFHKAGPDDRAILSAASLTKPGTFTMSTIDAQRFGGLSLFAVLPGPLSPQETFDELLSTARNLNSRLQGALQDERGEPLTPMRSASIRQSLSEGNGSSGHGEGAGSQSETRQ
jgi:FtsZ-interacting cell division protein ZipA